MKYLITTMLLMTTPASAVTNDDLHAPLSALIGNGVNLYLYKTQPELNYRQRWVRSFGACLAVGVAVEAYQGLSGTGTADLKDVGRDALGCALQFKWKF